MGRKVVLGQFSDLVTGTTAGYTGGGAYDAKEDGSEPLGQKIEMTDPGTSYPTSYAEVLNFASDPEWQCMAGEAKGSNFRELPVHCQKSRAQSRDFNIAAAFGFTKQVESPQRVTNLTDSPIPDMGLPGGNSPSNTAMAFALDSSSKREHNKGAFKSTDIPETHIGEFTVDVLDDSIPGFVDASMNSEDYTSDKCLKSVLTVRSNKSNPTAQRNREAAMLNILVKAHLAGFLTTQAAYALATAEVETSYFTQLREIKGSPLN